MLIGIFLVMLSLPFDSMAQSSPQSNLLPDITYESLEGQQMKVSALRDSVVYLNFWGTWCGPCLDEIPALIQLTNQLGSGGLKVVGVAVASGSSDEIQSFIQAQGINYHVVIGDMTQVKNILQVRGFPSSFLIDRTGVIQRRYFGPQTVATLRNDITELLSLSFASD